MADYFHYKSKSLKGVGFTLLGAGACIAIVGTVIAINGNVLESDMATGGLLAIAGLATMGISYARLASGSKAKGRAEMLYVNPDASKIESLTKSFNRKAWTHSVIAWSLLGTGIVLPIILQNSADPYYGMSKTAETVSVISMLGIFVSIPFFMEAAKNKGRVSVLTRTEHLPTSFIQGSGTHRSIGIGFPIGK